ncbi:hypothetical protein [Asticcacaulis sp.]|uniref:hypothetical protein n=1 Tax=Asticcacaulis sp. TaxID=1872648 RepID=UPI003F7BE15B
MMEKFYSDMRNVYMTHYAKRNHTKRLPKKKILEFYKTYCKKDDIPHGMMGLAIDYISTEMAIRRFKRQSDENKIKWILVDGEPVHEKGTLFALKVLGIPQMN